MTKEIDYKKIKVVGDGRGTMQGDYLLNKDRRMDRIRWVRLPTTRRSCLQ